MNETRLNTLLGESLKYFQRILYSLKNILINQEEQEANYSKILRLTFKDVIRRLRKTNLNYVFNVLNDDEIKTFRSLYAYYMFVVEQSHIEYAYIIDQPLYEKKLEYVVSKTSYIINQLVTLSYKLESIAFENQ